MNDYREHQLRELLAAWQRGDARLSVPQMKSLMDWEDTPDKDTRRLEAALSVHADNHLAATFPAGAP